LRYAEKMLALEDEILVQVTGKEEPFGLLSVRAPQTIGTYFLPEVIEVFNKRFPKISLDISSCAFHDLQRELKSGITDVGRFFTISTLVMIALRLSGGFLFDKINKVKVLLFFMALLVPCFILFGHIHSDRMLALMAVAYGLCIGVILPLLNATLFEVSPPHLRGLNTNLALFMMDAGFFLSPYAGGLFLGAGYSISMLFSLCAGFLVLSLVFLAALGRGREPRPAELATEANP